MSQPPDDHLKALWQGQDTETPTMTAQAVRMLVNDYQTTARRNLYIGLGFCVLCAGFFVLCARIAPNGLVRIGDLILLAWTPGMAWILWRRQPERAPGGETSTLGLIDFHRAQVAREAWDLRSSAALVVVMLPIFAGMAVILAGVWPKTPRMYVQLLPLMTLLAIWLVIYVLQLRRQNRRVQDRLREIDALRA